MNNKIYYKLVCIDETHAVIAELNIYGSADATKVKVKRLGRAVIVSIDTENIDPRDLAEINYLLSSVRVHAMAYDDELTEFDREEIDKV